MTSAEGQGTLHSGALGAALPSLLGLELLTGAGG